MAKVSMIQRDVKRKQMAEKTASRRKRLKAIIMNKDLSTKERFDAQLLLATMPRNASSVRQRNRCGITGRPRGYHRKFNMSRIALRELASTGYIPGMTKASW